MELIVKSYGAQFEGDGSLLPFGALAARYNTTKPRSVSVKNHTNVYKQGGAYAVIREPSDQNRLVSVLKTLPGEHIEEKFMLEPTSGQTIVLPAEEASEEIADTVIKLSQETHAIKYVKPAGTEKPKKKPDKDNDKGLDGKKGQEDGRNDDDKNDSDPLQANDDR